MEEWAVKLERLPNIPKLPSNMFSDSDNFEKYMTALNFEIKIVCYSSEDLWGEIDQRRCQMFFRSGRNIKRIVGLLLIKGRLTGKGVTCRDLVLKASSSRSTIHLILKDIVSAGWADKVRLGSEARYYAQINMFSYWKERYDDVFEKHTYNSEWDDFLSTYFKNNPEHLSQIKTQ